MQFSLLPVAVVFLLAAREVRSCSEPIGYETKPNREVLSHQSLVVYGIFTEQNNTHELVNGYNRPVLRLTTHVHCVLRNKNNIPISNIIKIFEVRPGGFNMPFKCTDYFCCTRMNAPAIISITPSEELPGEFEFQEYNLQGHTYYTDHSDFKDGKWVADFEASEATTDGECPKEPVTFSGVDRPTGRVFIITALLVVLIGIFV